MGVVAVVEQSSECCDAKVHTLWCGAPPEAKGVREYSYRQEQAGGEHFDEKIIAKIKKIAHGGKNTVHF